MFTQNIIITVVITDIMAIINTNISHHKIVSKEIL